jgi:hypothetical protein
MQNASAKFAQADSSKPWPENISGRPSVSDLPRKKTDVLKWGDEL